MHFAPTGDPNVVTATITNVSSLTEPPVTVCGRTVLVSQYVTPQQTQTFTYNPSLSQDNVVGSAATQFVANVSGSDVPVSETGDFEGTLNAAAGTLTFTYQAHYLGASGVPDLNRWGIAASVVVILLAAAWIIRRRTALQA